jgi:diguanylate cyclase (GGDEF)-like protein/PAS domain S-box-containing protein
MKATLGTGRGKINSTRFNGSRQPGGFPRALEGDSANLGDADWAKLLWDAAPLGIFAFDARGRCVYTNPAYEEITGLTYAESRGTRWTDALHPEDEPKVLAGWRKAALSHRPFHMEARLQRPDGRTVWARLHAAVTGGDTLQPVNLLMIEDISEYKSVDRGLRNAEEALFAEKARAQVVLDSIGDAVLSTDRAGNLTYMNREAESLTGWSREEALGRPLAEVFHIFDGASRSLAPNPAVRAMEEDRTVELALGCVLVRRDGSELEIEDSAAPIHDRDGVVAGAVIVFHDVAQSRAVAERMAYLARHDYLTGLANPSLLTERLTQAIGLAKRHQKQVGLLFIDLDDFKRVNDSLGHLVGDRLLESIARRLQTCVRGTDTVCRRGGDEFVILLAEIECPQDAAYVAKKVLEAVSAPQFIDGIKLQVSASIGISVYPDHGDDLVTLMQCADTAMYQVKSNGHNDYRFFGAGRPRRRFGSLLGGAIRSNGDPGHHQSIPYFLQLENQK